MVKAKKEMKEAIVNTLEQENIILRQKLADQERLQADQAKVLGGGILEEISKIRLKGKSTANTIVVTEKNDHRNISLWTRWGKRIGPLHPDNAIQTLQRFATLGIMLSSDQPTAQQIDEYRQTKEYKNLAQKEGDKRAVQAKSKRAGYMESVLREIAKNTGVTVDALHHILKPSEIGKQ